MSSRVPRVEEADVSKPDPDEPWRYVCPNCGSQVSKSSIAKYECTSCHKLVEKGQLRDQKTGKKFHELV